jgi:hypothetical protein
MTEAEFQALLEALKKGLLNEAGKKALADELRRRMIERFGEEAMKAADEEIAKQLAKEASEEAAKKAAEESAKRGPLWRLLLWLRGLLGSAAEFLGPFGAGALLLFALCLLGYSIYNVWTSEPGKLRAGPTCGGNVATGLGPISEWATFQTQMNLFNTVMERAQKQCDTYKCPTASADGSNWGVWRQVTFLKWNCTCEMLP